MQSSFYEYIAVLLERSSVTVKSTLADRARVDYVFLDDKGKRVALEVKGHTFDGTKEHFKHLINTVQSIANHVDKFLLVTPFTPNADALRVFGRDFGRSQIEAEWLSGDQFAGTLGLDAALSRRYRSSDAEVTPSSALDRQLSQPLIRKLRESSAPAESFLRIGERVPVVVVLSDLKSFSLLVKATKPDDLNDAMSKYYRIARELVWAHGGVLDKFIGDAVLAIFGYPAARQTEHVSATRFAADLVEVGKPILEGIKDLINEAIDTGTRVGISTGEISVLNIGLRSVELSFVGDVINLASRLEHECEVDSCLIDNLTKVAIRKADETFFKKLSLQGKKLEREQVKGQLTSIQAWGIPSSVLPSISNLNRALSLGNGPP